MIYRIVLTALVVFLLAALAVTAALWVDVERRPRGLAEQTISGPVIYASSLPENWDEQACEAALQRYYAEGGMDPPGKKRTAQRRQPLSCTHTKVCFESTISIANPKEKIKGHSGPAKEAEMTPLDRISGYAHVAVRYGVEEAIFMDSIVYWYKENRANDRNFYDGRWWTFNSMRAFDELFPWWSAKQIRRIINSCREQGALLAGNYNEDHRDRTVWYSPSDEVLELYGVPKPEACICPNGQMQLPEGADSSAQMGEPLPCNTHVDNIPPIVPPQGDAAKGDQKGGKPRPDWDLFERFWKAYPRHRYKDRARRAWQKLNPSLETCRAMAAALERDKQSRQWTKDNGEYVPHASTWLNNRPWEDGDEAPPPGEPEPLRGQGVRYL